MFNALLRCKQLPKILLEESQGFGIRNWIFHLWPKCPRGKLELILEGRVGETKIFFEQPTDV